MKHTIKITTRYSMVNDQNETGVYKRVEIGGGSIVRHYTIQANEAGTPTNIDMTFDEYNDDMNEYDRSDMDQILIKSLIMDYASIDCGYTTLDGDRYFQLWED